MSAKVSIIIRTRNEERWIGLCLEAVFSQVYKDFEVILVDNKSTDKTVEKATKWPVHLVEIEDFKPGRAINVGIENSSGQIIVCLSGHCIPTDSSWLNNLIEPLLDPAIGGVYGRQEPLSLTSDLNRRDLYITFGLDSRVQHKDSFFHNANSAFRREVWERCPFDDNVSNIEDRVWGKKLLQEGFKIRYEATASVYHYHGIHHDAQKARAKRIVEIMEVLEGAPISISSLTGSSMNIGIVATRENHSVQPNMRLFQRTLSLLKQASHIKDIVVTTTDQVAARMAGDFGCIVHQRSIRDSDANLGIQDAYSDALKAYESEFGIPDSITLANEIYPFRGKDTFNRLYRAYIESGADAVVCGHEEKRPSFLLDKNNETVLNRHLQPRQSVDSELAVCSVGLGCVVNPDLVRNKAILSANFLVLSVQDEKELIEVRNREDLVKFKHSIEDLLS